MKRYLLSLALSSGLLAGLAQAEEPVCQATLSNATLDFGKFGKFGAGTSSTNGPQSVGKQLTNLQITCNQPTRFVVRAFGRRMAAEPGFAFGKRGDTLLSVQSARLDGRAAEVGLSETPQAAPASWATQLAWTPGKYLVARDGADFTRPHTQLNLQLMVEPRLNPHQSDSPSAEELTSHLIFLVRMVQ